jgi:outer membrane protein assembly factor BamB
MLRITCSIAFIFAGALHAENWPGFRGPTGMGQSAEKDLPVEWGGKDERHVLWKAPLPHFTAKGKPDNNQSSPICWNDKIVVTTSFWPVGRTQKEFPEHHVTCFSTRDGKQLWDSVVEPGTWLLTDLRGGYTCPSPATDGERIYAFFGSSVVAALDMDGKQVWRKEIAEPKKFDVAISASPVLHGDTLLILCDKMAGSAHLLALDKKTGAEKWNEKRPDVTFSHTTPVLASVGGKEQLFIGSSKALQGVDPANGKVLWWALNQGDVPVPIMNGGLVYCDNGRGGVGIAVDPTGSGDVTKTHVKWKTDKRIGGLGSAVVVGEFLFRLRDPGLVACWKMATGETLSEERVQGVNTNVSPFATADGRVYFASAGRSVVVQAGPKVQILATNELGEDNGSSAAVSGGRIYLKGKNNLFAIGKK